MFPFRKIVQSPFLSALLTVPLAYALYLICVNLVVAVGLFHPAYPLAGTAKAIVIYHKTGCGCSIQTSSLVAQSVKLCLPVVVVCENKDKQIEFVEQTYKGKNVKVVVSSEPYLTSKFSPTGKVMASLVHYGNIVRQVPGDTVINAAFADESQGEK